MSKTRSEKFLELKNLRESNLSQEEIFTQLAHYYRDRIGVPCYPKNGDYRVRVKELFVNSIKESKELPLRSIVTLLLNVEIKDRYFAYDIIVEMEKALNKAQDALKDACFDSTTLTEKVEDSVVFVNKLLDILNQYGY